VRKQFIFFLLALSSIFFRIDTSIAQSSSSYNELQAAYIFNFAKYIRWPDDSPTFVVGVYGDAKIMSFLKSTFVGRRIGSKEVVLLAITKPEEIMDCNIVYVPESGSKNIKGLNSSVLGKGILIVTEEDLIKKGATISFIVEDDRLKFKLKQSALSEAGLTATPGLLKLAILE
jgi:hypothetical protein